MSAFCLCCKPSSISLRGRSSSLLGTSWTVLPWQTTATLLFRHLSGVSLRSGFYSPFNHSLFRPWFDVFPRSECFVLAFQCLPCCAPCFGIVPTCLTSTVEYVIFWIVCNYIISAVLHRRRQAQDLQVGIAGNGQQQGLSYCQRHG